MLEVFQPYAPGDADAVPVVRLASIMQVNPLALLPDRFQVPCKQYLPARASCWKFWALMHTGRLTLSFKNSYESVPTEVYATKGM